QAPTATVDSPGTERHRSRHGLETIAVEVNLSTVNHLPPVAIVPGAAEHLRWRQRREIRSTQLLLYLRNNLGTEVVARAVVDAGADEPRIVPAPQVRVLGQPEPGAGAQGAPAAAAGDGFSTHAERFELARDEAFRGRAVRPCVRGGDIAVFRGHRAGQIP